MLITMIAAASALTGLVLCLGTGAFESLAWLWLLPVSLALGFVVFAGLFFAFLLAVIQPLDPHAQKEKDSRFYRTLANLCIEAILTFARIRVHTKGLEKTPKEGRFLLVCNHLHEADPAILLHYFRKSQLAFVSKRENANMFIVGKLMPQLLCPLINRENDREALKTILRCIQLLKEDKVSVAVFPEGYIRPDRKFHELRPGVFKIAQKAKVPIVVCTMTNTNHTVKNFLKGKPTDVGLHLLEVIPAEFWQDKTTVEVADYVHKIMAEDLGEAYRPAVEENT